MARDENSPMPTRLPLSRREFLRRAGHLGLGAAGAGLLAACGGSPAGPPDSAGTGAGTAATTAPAQAGTAEVTISMMGWGSLLEKENVQKGLDLFQSQNPTIKVNWLHTPNDEYPT